MKREFAEAVRFARHVGGRCSEAARSAFLEAPAAIVVAAVTIGLPLGMTALVGQVIR